MPHRQEEKYDSAPGSAGGVGVLRMALNWIIAALSLAAVGGFVFWAMSIGTRDPNDVPIIRAMEGPARVLPDDPGGAQASHQGLAVNAVQAEGGVEAPANRVVLAPAAAELAEEDKAGAGVVPVARPNRVAGQPTGEPVRQGAAEPMTRVDIVAAAIMEDIAAAEKTSETTAEQEPASDNLVQSVIAGTNYSPAQSLRPASRPSDLSLEIAAIEPTAATDPADDAVDSVPIGTRLVQLGAYDSAALALSEWAKLYARHGDLLEGKKRLVQQAESGGRKFYRLRAVGFNSLDESRTLCSALLARGTPCIPVTAR